MELKVVNDQGQQTATLAAADTVFGREYNEALVHQIVVAYQANARLGTRAQLTREASTTLHANPGARKAQAVHVPVCLPLRYGAEAAELSPTHPMKTSHRKLTRR